VQSAQGIYIAHLFDLYQGSGLSSYVSLLWDGREVLVFLSEVPARMKIFLTEGENS
jgi:hypothetical protein